MASFTALPLDTHLSNVNNSPVHLTIPHEKSLLNSISQTYRVSDLEFNDDRYPLFTRTLGHQRSASSMDRGRAQDQLSTSDYQAKDAGDWSRGTGNYEFTNGKQAGWSMRQQTHEQHVVSSDSLVQPSSSSLGPTADIRNLTPSMPGQRELNRSVGRASRAGFMDQDVFYSQIDEGSANPDTTKSDSPKSFMKSTNRPGSSDSRRPAVLNDYFQTGETLRNSAVYQELSPQDTLSPLHPSTPRHPSVPTPSRESINKPPSAQFMTSADLSPSYKSSPVPLQMSSVQRVSVQQPTYITPAPAADPINPLYSPGPPPVQEEVCIECAMRDQDMADVDVTSPGVWERESDIHYQELLQREVEEEAKKATNPDYVPTVDPSRPKAKGEKLSEQNIKIWISLNPREPQSRRQGIEAYVRTQFAFLEAEALARARALKESRAIDNMMRSTYDHLRRSTIDSNQAGDEAGGLRIRTSRSISGQFDGQDVRQSYHSREVTLLENGLIVEHVDVRKEEKEEKERRKKEERRERSRARKSSRSSIVDVMSMYSSQAPFPPLDGDTQSTRNYVEGRPVSRFSQLSSRPLSPSTHSQIITSPPIRSANGRLLSQVSLADTQSISSASYNKRSKFFAFRNWSEAWKSRESFAPSGMSGSMLDMHVALDNEAQHSRLPALNDNANGVLQEKPDDQWPAHAPSKERGNSLDRVKKRKKGLGKIWRIFSGGKGSQKESDMNQRIDDSEKNDDDLPLTPPPPISYLVDRKPMDRAISSRSPSVSPSMSPNGASVSSPPSSSLNTPPIHQVWPDLDFGSRLKLTNDANFSSSPVLEEGSRLEKRTSAIDLSRTIMPMLSEPDIRLRLQQNYDSINLRSRPPSMISTTPRPYSTLSLDKTLPPLPHEAPSRVLGSQPDPRPQTMYDVGSLQDDGATAVNPQHYTASQNAFRDLESRRKSFGGLSSRPDMSFLTLPVHDKSHASKQGYIKPDEFGASHQSLGLCSQSYPFPTQIDARPPSKMSQTSSKRKSKFSLGMLIGKITHETKPPVESPLYVNYKLSYTGSQNDSINGYNPNTDATPRRNARVSRMSVASRKAVEELVDQDPNFIAYRYPSADQTIDILQ